MLLNKKVEIKGVEPLTSSMPWMRSSQLSYIPFLISTYLIIDKYEITVNRK